MVVKDDTPYGKKNDNDNNVTIIGRIRNDLTLEEERHGYHRPMKTYEPCTYEERIDDT